MVVAIAMNWSDACERNKGPILRILTDAFARTRSVLEIGSGTGQHAVYFAANLPHLTWQPSDQGAYLPGLHERIRMEGPPNLRPVIELDVRKEPWSVGRFEAIFTANTLHIMSWSAVKDLFRGVGATLEAPGLLCIYGPFRYGGAYTSPSNAEFDLYLKQRYPDGGIRDFEAVDALAREQGLVPVADHAMPANNQTLLWRKPPTPLINK
jgi:cyclopropane fatty-acyl-phospholipid synthase-like methyltransferase